MNFFNGLGLILLATMAIAGAPSDYNDPTPMTLGEWNNYLDNYDKPDYDNITALQREVAALKATGTGSSDATEIYVEGGNLVMANQAITPGMKIHGNGATIVVNGNGSAMLNSTAPEAGAGANSQIGEGIKTPARNAISNTQTLKLSATQHPAVGEAINTTSTVPTAYASQEAYEDWIAAWISDPARVDNDSLAVSANDVTLYPRLDAKMEIIPNMEIVIDSTAEDGYIIKSI